MRIFTTLLLTLSFWILGTSCINTSYSRHDEVEITDKEVHLILGMFAHHGEAFYQHEVTRTRVLLKKDPKDFKARNDLASAYIKLGKYSEAEREFALNEKNHPGKYETAANRGVLFKKMGRFEESAAALRDSFKIKPEGHMGLADYYLKMVEWKALLKEGVLPERDFLGQRYVTDLNATKVEKVIPVEKEFLLTLVKNDYKFPDVYWVLGKHYQQERNYQLAIRCFYRAKELGHPREELIYSEIAKVEDKMEQSKGEGQVMDREGLRSQIYDEMNEAESWLAGYQVVEQQRLQDGEAVDFKTMKSLSEVAKPTVYDAGVFEGEVVGAQSYAAVGFFLPAAVVALVVLLLIIFFVVKLVGKQPVRAEN